MPKLLSRFKHEELESNSALQIRDQKERRAENARKEEHKVEEKGKQWNVVGLRKFRNQRIFAGCTVHPACHYSHFSHCSFLLLVFAF